MTGAEVQPLERGAGVSYVACGGIWVMILFAPPTKADMLLARPSLATMKRKNPRGFSTLTWVLPEAGYRMEQDARQAAAEVTKEFDSAIVAQATLVEGSGFQAAAVRAIIAGLDAMSRSSGIKKVFSQLGPAAAWCLERRPAGAAAVDAADVARSLAAARGAVSSRPA